MSPDSPAAGPRPPVVDVHWHHVPQVLVDHIANGTCVFDGEYRREGADEVLAPAGGLPIRLVDTLTDPWCARAHLNAAGIDVGLASLAPPLIQYEAPPAQALHYSRLVNDAFADIQSAHAGRILALANVPLQDPVAAAAEARRAVLELQLTGIALGSSVGEHSLGDAVLAPFWEALGELDTFVFVHGIQSPTWRKRVRSAEVLGSFVGLPVDLALSVASLIFGGVLERHPGLKICFSHGGGAFPYLLGRWEHGWKARPSARRQLTIPPSESLAGVYCDSLVHDEQALRFLVDAVGIDHVLLGSDFPFDMGAADPVATIRDVLGGGHVQDRICGGSAATLLAREVRR